MKLIGREKEIELLNRYMESQQAEFVAMYGRRRIGKTFLLTEVLGPHMVFETSGVINGSADDQYAAFNQSLRRYGYEGPSLHNWMDIFFALENLLTPKVARGGRCVIFIDELPCLDIRGSRFLAALTNFWNSFVCKHANLMLVVCGSATSWMINNIVDNHGGLHNRITHEIHLRPFDLHQTEEYFKSRGFTWDRLSVLQMYMALGGVPYYMSLVDKGESVPAALDRLFFNADGEMRKEYDRLFRSLFKDPEPYYAIVSALAKSKQGLSRDEIAKSVNKSVGGRLSEQLENLIRCDFVRQYKSRTKRICKNSGVYQLVDFYTLFYHTFLTSGGTTDEHFWSTHLLSPRVSNWYGLAFERVCMAHIPHIKKAIGIERIATEYYSWRSNADAATRAQIDLVIERADRVANVCEVKYSEMPYAISKDEEMKLRTRMALFASETGIRQGLALTMITTYGLMKNTHSNVAAVELTMDDLFVKE